MPLRLINVPFDSRVRSGLEQLAEECSREASREDEADGSLATSASNASLQDLRQPKRMRVASHDTSSGRRMARFPLAYKSAHSNVTPARPASGSFPRSILKSSAMGETPKAQGSRSISFMDQKPPRSNDAGQTARMDRMLEELEQMNLTKSQSSLARSASADCSTTNASFRLTRDKLVEILTDAAPWEPDWHTLKQIDLRARRLESCIGLSEHLPNVQEVWLDHNQVSFAMGIPSSVRVLTASHNVYVQFANLSMSELTSFEHLKRLQVLDISHNEFTSVMPLVHLPELRELRADHNQMTDLRGLEQCTSLRRLSVSHNALKGCVDLRGMCWPVLEFLALSHNHIREVVGLESVAALQALCVDANELTALTVSRTLPHLRTLRVCDNAALGTLDVSRMPSVRTVYADRCCLATVKGLASAHELQYLSLRQQGTRMHFPLPVSSGLKRLYFAGNVVRSKSVLPSAMPSLVYLELAGCQLSEVQAALPTQTPALRSLNLDHNPLRTLPSLAAWTRLKRVSVVGCCLDTLETIVRAVHGMPQLCVLDTRTNPCTLGLYPPLMLPPTGSAIAAPVPDPAIVQPDAAQATEQRMQKRLRAARALAERSQFHKRTMLLPPVPPADPPAESERAMDAARTASLFQAADAPFQRTLSTHTLQKRRIYRGLCGMACATLTWLDGLELSDADVQCAAQQLERDT